MYTTIEADIENGMISVTGKEKLPAKAHVLITLLSDGVGEKAKIEEVSATYRMPHPDLKSTVELNGEVFDSAPVKNWDLPE